MFRGGLSMCGELPTEEGMEGGGSKRPGVTSREACALALPLETGPALAGTALSSDTQHGGLHGKEGGDSFTSLASRSPQCKQIGEGAARTRSLRCAPAPDSWWMGDPLPICGAPTAGVLWPVLLGPQEEELGAKKATSTLGQSSFFGCSFGVLLARKGPRRMTPKLCQIPKCCLLQEKPPWAVAGPQCGQRRLLSRETWVLGCSLGSRRHCRPLGASCPQEGGEWEEVTKPRQGETSSWFRGRAGAEASTVPHLSPAALISNDGRSQKPSLQGDSRCEHHSHSLKTPKARPGSSQMGLGSKDAASRLCLQRHRVNATRSKPRQPDLVLLPNHHRELQTRLEVGGFLTLVAHMHGALQRATSRAGHSVHAQREVG